MKFLALAFALVFSTQAFAQSETAILPDLLVVEGPIAKVVTRKTEIYVQGPDRKHEFYFKPFTQLLEDGKPAEFSKLLAGMKVKVSYKMVGKREEPVKVEILK